MSGIREKTEAELRRLSEVPNGLSRVLYLETAVYNILIAEGKIHEDIIYRAGYLIVPIDMYLSVLFPEYDTDNGTHAYCREIGEEKQMICGYVVCRDDKAAEYARMEAMLSLKERADSRADIAALSYKPMRSQVLDRRPVNAPVPWRRY